MFLLMTTTCAFSEFAVKFLPYRLLLSQSPVFLPLVERLNLKEKSCQLVEMFQQEYSSDFLQHAFFFFTAVIPSELANFMTIAFLFRGLCGRTSFTLATDRFSKCLRSLVHRFLYLRLSTFFNFFFLLSSPESSYSLPV